MPNRIRKILFLIRITLWLIAAGATIYWIEWSFKLYEMGIHIEKEYAAALRPILTKGLLISVLCLCISYLLGKLPHSSKTGHND